MVRRKQGSTLFLKCIIWLFGLVVLALCLLALPKIAYELADHYPAYWLYPALVGMYVTAVPFYFALYEAYRLLVFIDKNTAFSELSVRALRNIKYCAISISAMYLIISPLLYLMAEKDDAPGILAFGFIIGLASLVIATFAAVLQRLLQEAIDIKSEHDLTV